MGGGVFWGTWNLNLGKKTKVFNWGGYSETLRFGPLTIFIGGGIRKLSDLDSLTIFILGGYSELQNRGYSVRIWTKISTTPAGSCITDSLSHTTYVETNDLKGFFLPGAIINPGSGKMVDAISKECRSIVLRHSFCNKTWKTEAIVFIYFKNSFYRPQTKFGQTPSHPPWVDPPSSPADGFCSWRYAFYWIAFLSSIESVILLSYKIIHFNVQN